MSLLAAHRPTEGGIRRCVSPARRLAPAVKHPGRPGEEENEQSKEQPEHHDNHLLSRVGPPWAGPMPGLASCWAHSRGAARAAHGCAPGAGGLAQHTGFIGRGSHLTDSAALRRIGLARQSRSFHHDGSCGPCGVDEPSHRRQMKAGRCDASRGPDRGGSPLSHTPWISHPASCTRAPALPCGPDDPDDKPLTPRPARTRGVGRGHGRRGRGMSGGSGGSAWSTALVPWRSRR